MNFIKNINSHFKGEDYVSPDDVADYILDNKADADITFVPMAREFLTTRGQAALATDKFTRNILDKLNFEISWDESW